ncbi:MAG TPA: hypothetical protein VKS60_01125, partial [Stellaceae bacterium]|nr:hypothetical protein [Stellaceae bacterium]
ATAGAALPHEVTVIGTLFGNKKLGNRGTPRALAIVHGNGALFLLTGSLGEDGDFFDTPIWNSDEPPVRTAARGSKDFVELRRHEPRLHNDAILVGTEAGIDMALYWNGRTYALYKPPEEP